MKDTILKYEAVFEEQEVGGFTVTVPALPGCISEGDTFEEAKKNIAEAITVYLESLAMDGEEIPSPDQSVFVQRIQVNRPSISPVTI
jgi:antitoxin HicB